MECVSAAGGRPTTPPRRGRYRLFFWLGLATFCTGLLALHSYARQREMRYVHTVDAEETRRQWVEDNFRRALYVLNEHPSADLINSRLAPLGTLSCTPIPGSARGWKVHVKNITGDMMDATITNHGTGGVIEFAGDVSPHTRAWKGFTSICWFLSLTIPFLLLAGLIAFFMPRHLHKWVFAIALLATVASTFTPEERRRPTFSKFSIAPTASLLIAGLAALMPRRRKRSLRYCKCGYDLTGNVSGICPECGTPLPPKPVSIVESLARNLEAIE